MMELIYEVCTSLIPSVCEFIFGKLIKGHKGWLILSLPAFSLGIISHATFPVLKETTKTSVTQFVESQWLLEGEKQIACQFTSKLSGYGHLPCYSIGEFKQEFSQGKSQAVYKYTNGTVALSPDGSASLGSVYIVAKSRSEIDFATNSLCDNGTYCLRKIFDLGQSGRITDTLTGESFDVAGMLAIELQEYDFNLVRTHLLSAEQPAYVAFVGHLAYRDYIPTRKGIDTLAFVLRLQNARLIYP